MGTYVCPNDGPFDAEPYTHVSQSGHDVPVVDASGQQPTMAAQLANVALTLAQWQLLETITNPSWSPTYEHVKLDDPQEHEVAVCPTCGSPIKVG